MSTEQITEEIREYVKSELFNRFAFTQLTGTINLKMSFDLKVKNDNNSNYFKVESVGQAKEIIKNLIVSIDNSNLFADLSIHNAKELFLGVIFELP